MRAERVISLAFLAVAMVAPATAEPVSTTVTIDSGVIEGAVSGGILSFKGIPYASPPVEELRWRPPQPVRWAGVRPAIDFGSDCLQMPLQTDIHSKPLGELDCLFLNVWRPAERTAPGERLPVLVWIHGGGYVIGGSSGPGGDASALARQGLVVVSLNYRLGRLGFFAHPALIAESGGADRYSGNFGLMDQIQALEWVKTNIEKFGGDNSQVTVAGESAGGVSVMHLLTSPAANGLFHRAIVMSGAGRRSPLLRKMTDGTAAHPSADMIGAEFAKSAGGIQPNDPEALHKLRGLDAKVLVQDLTFDALIWEAVSDDPHASLAMIDKKIVAGEPEDAICLGGTAKMPLIIGTVKDDLPIFFPPRKEPYPYAYFGPDAGKAREIYGPIGFLAVGPVGTDITMHEPARFVAKAMTAAGKKAWLYRFTYVVESEDLLTRLVGAKHSTDVAFLFQTLDAKYPGRVSPKDREVARAFSSYFANFARSDDADPNTNGLPHWPNLDPKSFHLMEFTLDQGPVFGDEPRKGVALVEKVARCP